MTEDPLVKAFRRLLIASVAEDVKRVTQKSLFPENDIQPLSEDEALLLLRNASVLANSPSDENRRFAYEVANRVAKAMHDAAGPGILAAALSRIHHALHSRIAGGHA
jgi:hypothetical protein